MKKLFITLILVMGFAAAGLAQDVKMHNGFGFGFQLNEYQNDFGMGLQITSPYYVNNRIAIRLRGNLMYNEHLKDNETIWTPYSNVSAGLIGVAGTVAEQIRLYGEGGVVGIFPSGDFSSDDYVFGGYGLFGFEFYFYQHGNYFIEIGGIGSGAREDLVETEPIYSNGLLISTGFRFLFE